ncbi:MAG: hypothetical protein JW871_01775 [Endomicrobiales bacterium]|nr:hypothetical protein [Endomicrobiales bacterium]
MLKKLFMIVLFFPVILFAREESKKPKSLFNMENTKIYMGMDYYSSYVWRGFLLDKDPVLQPNFSVSHSCKRAIVTAGFFSSWDFGNADNLSSDEADFSVDFTKSFKKFNLSIGNIYYNFPGARTYSSEFYLGLQLPKAPLMPNIKYYYDYGTGDGSYVSLDLVKSFDFLKNRGMNLSIGAHMGLNSGLFIKGKGRDYSVISDLGFTLAGNLGCSLVLGYSIPFGDLADSSDGNQNNVFYGGLRLGAGF